MAFEDQEVEDAEDQDKDGCLGEEAGAATSGDDGEVEEGRGGDGCSGALEFSYEGEAGWVLRGVLVWMGGDFGAQYIFVKHKHAFVVPDTRVAGGAAGSGQWAVNLLLYRGVQFGVL